MKTELWLTPSGYFLFVGEEGSLVFMISISDIGEATHGYEVLGDFRSKMKKDGYKFLEVFE